MLNYQRPLPLQHKVVVFWFVTCSFIRMFTAYSWLMCCVCVCVCVCVCTRVCSTCKSACVCACVLWGCMCVCAWVCNAGLACLVSCDLNCLLSFLLFFSCDVSMLMEFMITFCTACQAVFVIGLTFIHILSLLSHFLLLKYVHIIMSFVALLQFWCQSEYSGDMQLSLYSMCFLDVCSQFSWL